MRLRALYPFKVYLLLAGDEVKVTSAINKILIVIDGHFFTEILSLQVMLIFS